MNNNEKKEELLTRMIHIYGFEHPQTIRFAELMETNIPVKALETLVKCHEEEPLF